MNIPFTKYRKIYFALSSVLILTSVVSLVIFGLNPGIDFTGGSILEIEYKTGRPLNSEILDQLDDFDLGSVCIQPTGESGVILRMKDIDEEVHQSVLLKLQEGGSILE